MSSSEADPGSMTVLTGISLMLAGFCTYKVIDNHSREAKKAETADVHKFTEQGFTNVAKEVGGMGVQYGNRKLVFNKLEDDSYAYKRFDANQTVVENVSFDALNNVTELNGCIN